jgi:hypothetical protein
MTQKKYNNYYWWGKYLTTLNPTGIEAPSHLGHLIKGFTSPYSKIGWSLGPFYWNSVHSTLGGNETLNITDTWGNNPDDAVSAVSEGKIYGTTRGWYSGDNVNPQFQTRVLTAFKRHQGGDSVDFWHFTQMVWNFVYSYASYTDGSFFQVWADRGPDDASPMGPWYKGTEDILRFFKETPDLLDAMKEVADWPPTHEKVFGAYGSKTYEDFFNLIFPYMSDNVATADNSLSQAVIIVNEDFISQRPPDEYGTKGADLTEKQKYARAMYYVVSKTIPVGVGSSLRLRESSLGNPHPNELVDFIYADNTGKSENIQNFIDVAIANFDKYQPHIETANIPNNFEIPQKWMKEIHRKAVKLLKRGMWLGRGKDASGCRGTEWANIGEGSKWSTYDPHFRNRSGTAWLQYKVYGTALKTHALYMAYSMYDSKGSGLNFNNSNDGESGDFDSKNPWIINIGATNLAEKMTGNSVVKPEVFNYTFKEGGWYAASKGNSGKPWLWSGKLDGTGVWGLDNQSEAPSIFYPNDYKKVTSEDYFNDVNLPSIVNDVSLYEIYKMPTRTELTFFQLSNEQANSFKNYRTIYEYIQKHRAQLYPGSATTSVKEYGIWAKYWTTANMYTYIGLELEKEDGTEAAGLLGEVYKNFKEEFAKEYADPSIALADKRTADQIFKEATTYAAYSLALSLMTIYRDELVFNLYDKLARIYAYTEDVSKEDMKGVIDEVEAGVEQTVEDASDAAAAAGAEELTEDEIEERQVFYKQCWLLSNMDTLSLDYRNDMAARINSVTPAGVANIHTSKNEFGGRIRLIDCAFNEDKKDIINKLTSPRGEDIEAFFNIRPELVSSLVPMVRLFKVFNQEGILREIEFDFPKSMSSDNSQYRAGHEGLRNTHEFGIKDFSFSFDGQSPATARNDIVADMTLFFRDFNDLIKKRELNEFTKTRNQTIDGNVQALLSQDSNKFSYLDLILFPGSVQGIGKYDNKNIQNPENYRIRADVGWSIRDDKMFHKLATQSGTTAEKIKSSLQKINKSFYLNMIDHDLDFKSDGSVTIKIKYRAYIESMAKTPSMDVLSTPELVRTKDSLQEELNIMWNKGCTAEQMNELINTYQAIEEEILKKSYQSIISRLALRQRIFYTYSQLKDKRAFASDGYFREQPSPYKPTTPTDNVAELQSLAGDDDIVTESFTYLDGELKSFNPADATTLSDKEFEIINYFYVGDLFHTVMDCMYQPPQVGSTDIVGALKDDVKNTMTLLSTFEYYNSFKDSFETLNIAEIPVSLDFFTEFMAKNVLEGERKSYPLMDFMRDICNKLIVELMNELCIKSPKAQNKFRFQTANILAAPAGGGNPMSQVPYLGSLPFRDVSTAYNNGILPFNTSLENYSIDQAWNMLVVYPVANNMSSDQKAGIRSEDEKNGIRHLYVGRPRGLVKTIKFSKVDMQYIREARYFNHGFNGLMQLGAVYTATIEMIGNTMFYPGMTIFINPISLGSEDMDPTVGGGNGQLPSLANALGIGGYHLINKVKSSISAGTFKTTVEAQFYYSGDKKTAHLVSNTKNNSNNDTDEEEDTLNDISKRQSSVASTDESQKFCNSVIVVRQAQLHDVSNPAYDINITDLAPGEDLATIVDEKAKERKAHIKQTKLDFQNEQAEKAAAKIAEEIAKTETPSD